MAELILILSVGVLGWIAYTIAGDLWAAPFVPTPLDEVEKILEMMQIPKGITFWDLGSGDGRLVIEAARKYGAAATGFEIHPGLVWWSRIRAAILKLKNAKFVRRNFFREDAGTADYIYFYLYPRAGLKLGQKFENECRPGTVIVSKTFAISGWERKLVKTEEIDGRRYNFYKS